MGLFKGSASLSRYQVKGDAPPDFWDFVDRRIRANVFLDIEQSTDESAVGWVSAHDFMDTNFAYAAYALDPYIVLGMRVDQRKVSTSLVRKYLRIEVKKALDARDGRPLSRHDREELKEKVRLDLLRRIPPTTQVYEVCWDTSKAELWLGAAGRGVRDLLEDLFRRSFDLALIPRLPYLVAGDLLGPGPLAQRLEAARPLSLYQGEA
ncbi:MAG: recombination-associated protein RdgC [Pseudomonadota bacterium]